MARAAPRQPGPPAGVIFGCNRSSEEESLNGLFGMSSGHWSLVKEIIPGTPCFLFNFNTKELHGVFRAVSSGSWNLDPLAYGGKQKEGSMYPAQVRVEYCPRCPPMEEQYFKPAIADNYFNPNRFRWELNERQVEELLDLFLGPGMPWPPRQNSSARSSRVERNPPAYYEDTSRSYAHDPVMNSYRDRGSPYARHRYSSRSPGRSPTRDYRRHLPAEEPRPRRTHEDLLPPSLQPARRHDDYRQSTSPRDRYREHAPALPQDLRLAPTRTDPVDLFRPQPIPDSYRPDLRHSMPPVSNAFSSMYADPMNIHQPAGAALRDPSLGPAPIAVLAASPPRQHLVLEPASRRQPSEPASPRWDFSQMSHLGDQFTGLASNTALVDQPVASLPALPADLSLSERFRYLPEHKEQADMAQVSTAPLRVSFSGADGRAVSFPQPDVPVTLQLPSSAEPTTLVIGSIPHSCTISTLVSILDQHHQDQYDFLHFQPSEDFDSTAVVNFIRAQHAQQFQDEMQDASWSDVHEFDPPTSAIASVSPHSIQGKDALMAHHGTAASKFAGAAGKESRLPANRPLFFFCTGRKRPAPADHEQAPPSARPRMPGAAEQDSFSRPAMQSLPPSLHTSSRLEPHNSQGHHIAAIKMEPDAGHGMFAANGHAAKPTSPSNISDHDRANIGSRPGSAAAISSRPPANQALEPLKITIKQEPGLGQITPSPDSVLDVMGHPLNMLEGPSRGVSSSPNRAAAPTQQEAAAFLQSLAPESRQHQHRSSSPRRRSKSPRRESHRYPSSHRHRDGKSVRDSDRQDPRHGSRRTTHVEHKSSKGVQKVSGRDRPPRDRSHKDKDRDRSTKHRSSSKAADVRPNSRSKPEQSASLPKPPTGKTVQVSVNAAPAFDQPSSSRHVDSPTANGMAEHDRQPHHFARSAVHAMEESGDNSEGLQQSLGGDAVQAKPITAGRDEQPPRAAVKHAEFGADFLAVPSSP